jgi:sterol desaturase/sphingolipid hydroxylase (fatty acid hydroxylase superfamily)|tara:strand:- start:66900 stop:67730 length:831 start_codon:yes stop_codon:yes gene_type:complete
MSVGLFYLVFGLGVLFLEIVKGHHRGIYTRADWFTNVLCGAVGMALVRPLAAVLTAMMFAALLPESKGAAADVPVWAGFLVTLVLAELLFYWVHRWAHEGRGKRPQLEWLWKLHRTHHSGKFMNSIVIWRINLFWALMQPQSLVIGLALYLGQVPAATAVGLSLYVWNIVTHSNFRWDDPIRRHRLFGPAFRALEHVIVSPGVHHSHHGYGKDGASYRNFAVILSLFDWAFGTLHIPKGRPWKYGVPGPNAHWSEEVFYPLVRRRPPEKRDGNAAA